MSIQRLSGCRLDSRANSLEIERVKTAIATTIELLSVEAIAVVLLTPVSFGQLMFRLAPLLVRLRRLVVACDAALTGYTSTERSLVANLHDFQSPVAPVAKSLNLFFQGPTSAWARPRGPATFAQAPTGIGQIAARLRLLSNSGQPVIRVERYQAQNHQRFIVYIPGTQNLSLSSNQNPFDMRSNLQLMAGERSNAARATELALRRAGATESDQVMLVGHSQGGLIALNLAERSATGALDYRVEQVVTFGTPAGMHSAKSLPNVVSFENRADLVPKLDLRENPSERNWTTLEGYKQADPVEAHRMESYEQILLEKTASGELEQQVDALASFASGKAEVSYFELGQR